MTHWRKFLFFVLSLVALLPTGCRSEYQVGFDQAVEDVREARRAGNFLDELGLMVIDELAVPVHSGHTQEWNRGYREGFHAELHRQ